MAIIKAFKKNINWKELQKSRPDLTIHKDTIHGAKGLEKDIVIILGNDSQKSKMSSVKPLGKSWCTPPALK